MQPATTSAHRSPRGAHRRRTGIYRDRFDSRADPETTLLKYLKLYNHHIPQRAIGTKTPIQALKEWQRMKPDLFVKRVDDRAGLDNYVGQGD